MEPEQPDLILALIRILEKQREKGLSTYFTPVIPNLQTVEFWLENWAEDTGDSLIYGLAALDQVVQFRKQFATVESERDQLRLRVSELEKGREEDGKKIEELEMRLTLRGDLDGS